MCPQQPVQAVVQGRLSLNVCLWLHPSLFQKKRGVKIRAPASREKTPPPTREELRVPLDVISQYFCLTRLAWQAGGGGGGNEREPTGQQHRSTRDILPSSLFSQREYTVPFLRGSLLISRHTHKRSRRLHEAYKKFVVFVAEMKKRIKNPYPIIFHIM